MENPPPHSTSNPTRLNLPSPTDHGQTPPAAVVVLADQAVPACLLPTADEADLEPAQAWVLGLGKWLVWHVGFAIVMPPTPAEPRPQRQRKVMNHRPGSFGLPFMNRPGVVLRFKLLGGTNELVHFSTKDNIAGFPGTAELLRRKESGDYPGGRTRKLRFNNQVLTQRSATASRCTLSRVAAKRAPSSNTFTRISMAGRSAAIGRSPTPGHRQAGWSETARGNAPSAGPRPTQP